MKGRCLIFLSFLLLGPAFSQEAPISQAERQAISDWVISEMMRVTQASQEAMRSGKPPEPGSLRIYSLKEHPVPEAMKKSIAEGIAARSRITTVSSEQIIKPSQVLATARGMRRTERELRSGLTFPPANVSQTALARAQLMGADYSGMRKAGKSSGLMRIYRLPGTGVIELSEDDYVSAGTQLTLVRESFNAMVDGTPAIAHAAKSTDGRGSATLAWVTPRRSYRLVLLTDNGNLLPQGQKLLLDTATRLVE